MGVVVQPSAREMFTLRELADAYKEFIRRGPQYLDAETGYKVSAYWFGERTLLVYEESETGLMVLVHPTVRNNAFWKLIRLADTLASKTRWRSVYAPSRKRVDDL